MSSRNTPHHHTSGRTAVAKEKETHVGVFTEHEGSSGLWFADDATTVGDMVAFCIGKGWDLDTVKVSQAGCGCCSRGIVAHRGEWKGARG
jgi:hypothetical protein